MSSWAVAIASCQLSDKTHPFQGWQGAKLELYELEFDCNFVVRLVKVLHAPQLSLADRGQRVHACCQQLTLAPRLALSGPTSTLLMYLPASIHAVFQSPISMLGST